MRGSDIFQRLDPINEVKKKQTVILDRHRLVSINWSNFLDPIRYHHLAKFQFNLSHTRECLPAQPSAFYRWFHISYVLQFYHKPFWLWRIEFIRSERNTMFSALFFYFHNDMMLFQYIWLFVVHLYMRIICACKHKEIIRLCFFY